MVLGTHKPVLKVKFVDFWPTFDAENNYLVGLLRHRYQIQLSDSPDLLFFSFFGKDHRKYECTRVLFSGETWPWSFENCDWALTSEYVDDARHLRLPLYAYMVPGPRLIKHGTNTRRPLQENRKFCNFLYSNGNAPLRLDFLSRLKKYKAVDCGGAVANNIGYRVRNKLAFISQYKFTIAFENGGKEGYCTEKISQPMVVNSIPIYWGNPRVSEDFNTGSFLSFHDGSSLEELVERIVAVDQNEPLYAQMLDQPWLPGNRVTPYSDPLVHRHFLENIIERHLV